MARRQGMARAFALGPAGSASGGPVALLRSRTLPVGFGDQPVPLNICAVLVPEAGSAPAPAVWKTAMHLSTPLGRGNWWTGRAERSGATARRAARQGERKSASQSRPPQNPCQGFSPLRNMPAHWWRRRNLHPPSRAANATRPYGTCAPIGKWWRPAGFAPATW